MKKKKVIITAAIAAAVLLLGIGIFVYCRYFRVRYEIVGRYGGITLEPIEWMGVAPDGISTCLVKYGGTPGNYPVVPGKYIVYRDLVRERRAVYRGDAYLGTEDFYEIFNLYTYDIVEKERTDLYDINEFIEQNYSGFELVNYDRVYRWEGQNVYIIKIKETTNWLNKKYIYINIEDGSYEEHENKPESWNSYENDILYTYNLFEQNLPQELVEKIHVLEYQNYEGVFEVTGLAEYLPEQNETLYGMFPELEQYRGEEDCYIYMLVGGNPSAEELLRLFMEDGQEISFEGAVLSGEQSIDGEDHEIHSFEEYERWRDYNK